jgi:hypothetical protein
LKKRGVVEKRGEEETKSMPHAPVFLSIKKWGCHAYNLLILSWINGSNNIELYSINKIMGPSLICEYWELEFPYWSPCYAGKDYLPSLTLLCGINYSTCKQIGGLN